MQRIAITAAAGVAAAALVTGALAAPQVKVGALKPLPAKRIPRLNGTKKIKPGTIQADRLLDDTLTGRQINEGALSAVPLAASATEADSADSAQTAETAQAAVNASNADTVGGNQLEPLAAVMPPGTTNATIGTVGPVSVRGSCGTGPSFQAISVSVTSSIAGSVRSAGFEVLPDGSSNDFTTIGEGGSAVLIDNSFNVRTEAFVFIGGGRAITGHFLAADSGGNGCMVSGMLAG